MVHRTALVALVLLPLAASPAAAEGAIEITPFLGARGGASLDSDTPGIDGAEANPSATLGVVVDWPVRSDARMEVSFDRQELEFEGEQGAAIAEDFDLTLDYFQFGGVYEPRQGRTRPFVLASIGLTHVAADGARVDESLSLSGSLGGGTKIGLGERLSLRLELRGHATFTDGAIVATCGPGCSVNLRTTGWYQLAGRIGLAVRVGGKRDD